MSQLTKVGVKYVKTFFFRLTLFSVFDFMVQIVTNQHWLYVSTQCVVPSSTSCLYHQLEAIRQTKVDMQVYLGNYNAPNDNNVAYDRQKAEIQNILQTYGPDQVSGITVGNEYILK